MSSCGTRRHVLLLTKKTCLLDEQVDMSCCLRLNKKTDLLVQHEDLYYCLSRTPVFVSTRRHIFLSNKRTCLLVRHEDMSSCWTRGHVFLLDKKICLLGQQEDMFPCWTGRHVLLFNKKTCQLVQQLRILYVITPGKRKHNWALGTSSIYTNLRKTLIHFLPLFCHRVDVLILIRA